MKKRILLIEDGENERLLYSEALRDEGYEILNSCNGMEACKVLNEEKVDLVILDIHMPKMDGIETIGKILAKQRDLPIILHTAFPQYKDQFLTWAADAYLIKSGDLAPLKERVRELLK